MTWRLWTEEELSIIQQTRTGELTRWQCYNQLNRSRVSVDRMLRVGSHINVKSVAQTPTAVPANDPGWNDMELTDRRIMAREGSARLLERLREVHGCG